MRNAHSGAALTISNRTRHLALGLLLALLAAPRCDRPPEPQRAEQQTVTAEPRLQIPRVEKPNILVYLVDALRADHLGVYGYERDTSPRLDELAGDAIVFDNAYAPSSWTKPSTASLLTGLNPNRHGAIGHRGRLAGVRLLGEFLLPLGYNTAAFTSNPWILPYWGFGPGFQRFNQIGRQPGTSLLNRRANRLIRDVLSYLREGAAPPFFTYVHTIDPHVSYAAPPPFDTKWPRLARRSNMMGQITRRTPPTQITDMIAGYDGEIAFGDHHFGVLLDDLRARGLYEDAFIVFTADHGEEFGEHGQGGHGKSLYDEVVRVPLIIKFPKNALAGRRVTTTVSLVDVVPTLLGYLEIDHGHSLDGIDLATVLAGADGAAPRRPLYLRCVHHTYDQTPPKMFSLSGILLGNLKYVELDVPTKTRMLFDLAADPAERSNVLPQDPDRAAPLAALLTQYQLESEPGIHIRHVNVVASDSTSHSFRLRLRTDGRFVDLRRYQFEADDTAELTDNQQVLRLEIEGTNRRDTHDPLQRNRWLVDEDAVYFNVQPADTTIVIEQYECDSAPEAVLYVGASRRPIRALPYRFQTSDEAVAARDVAGLVQVGKGFSLAGPAGAYLAVVPTRTTVDTRQLDPGIAEQLKDLGYLGGN